MTDATAIADKLTKAQREAMLTGTTLGHLARYDLAAIGLVDRNEWNQAYKDGEPPRYTCFFTPLGLAVRAILQEQITCAPSQ